VAQKTGTLYHALIPHGLSSRYPLKLKHDRCQELLVRWAEPMAALAVMEASPTHRGFLDLSWEYLLLDQPHDSICGCSIDETHDDMPYRFHQSELLADGVRRQSIARIVPASAKGSDFANVVVWNPLPWSRLGVQQVEIFFPTTFPAKAKRSGHLGPSVNQFQLFDSHGSLLPFQILEVQTNVTRKGPDSLGRRALLTGPLDVYLLAVEIDLPPTGYAGFEVQPLDASLERQTGTLRTGALSAANEHLSIHVHDSGRVDLIDKASGRAYLDLFAYEDSGDAGDGWNFVPPLRNRIIVGPGDSVTVCVEEDGPLVVTFCIDRRFRLPVGLDPLSRESRVDKTEDVLVRDFLSLRKGEKFLRVRTDVKNTVGNHRLKVLLPTHVESDTYWSDQPFAWVERPIATDPGSARYKEPDPIERPHHSVIAIGNQSGGLAVLTPEGLHEHSISDDPSRTIGLTLFRAVDKTHTTDGEPQGQLLQAMDFSYALLPFQGSKPPQEILRVVAELQAGIYCHHASKTLTRQSWLRLDGPSCVSLSCIKPADSGNGLVVRLWNSSNAPVQSKIIVSKPIREGWSCDLQESIISRLNLDGDCLSLDVPAFGLITVFLQL
jgi:hypothetical protein